MTRSGFMIVATMVIALGCSGRTNSPPEWPEPPSLKGKDFSTVEWYSYLVRKRQIQLTLLEQYVEAGEFPPNQDFPKRSVPYFVGAEGRACAVAHLMLREGLKDEVEDVRSSNNHVRIADVKSGYVFEWMLYSGLTHEECALIQPSYPPYDEDVARERIREHLRKVLNILRQSTIQSLSVVLQRLLSRFGEQGSITPNQFKIVMPGIDERYIENPGKQTLEYKAAFVKADGTLVKDYGWNALKSGQVRDYLSPERTAFLFLEWRQPPTNSTAGLIVRAY